MKFTIEIQDEKVERVLAAFSKVITPGYPPERRPATVEEVEQEIKKFVRQRVIDRDYYEAAEAKRKELREEIW